MRGIHNGSRRHILSLINQDCLPLCQMEVETKENEITTFKTLLTQLLLPQGALLTGDAMFTQTDFKAQDLPVGFSSVKTLGYLYTVASRPDYLGTGEKFYINSKNLVFFISSNIKSAQEFSQIIRDHWRIENNLHWLKDTLYGEDSQTLTGTPAHLFTFLKSLVLGLIKQISTHISSTIRRIASNPNYLNYVLRRWEVI